jgi:hypothetical protein
MKKLFRFYFTLIFFSFSTILNCQKLPIRLFSSEIKLLNLFSDSLKKIPEDSSRLNLNNKIIGIVESIIKNSASFNIHLDSLKHIGRIISPDNRFSIISWNVPLNDGSHEFFGYVQLSPEKDSICKIFKLKDNSGNIKSNISEMNFSCDTWYGALYYEIVPRKIYSKTVYTLLGMHYNDLFTNRKIIEALYFNEEGFPMFGTPIYIYNGHEQNRIVFDYSISVSMMLRFDAKLNMFVFDHLAPPSPLYSGNFKYYGPDFSVDGLKFEDNKWIYYPNVNYHK